MDLEHHFVVSQAGNPVGFYPVARGPAFSASNLRLPLKDSRLTISALLAVCSYCSTERRFSLSGLSAGVHQSKTFKLSSLLQYPQTSDLLGETRARDFSL